MLLKQRRTGNRTIELRPRPGLNGFEMPLHRLLTDQASPLRLRNAALMRLQDLSRAKPQYQQGNK
jgi:hypothetical protein